MTEGGASTVGTGRVTWSFSRGTGQPGVPDSVWNGRLLRHPHLRGSFTYAVNGADIRREGASRVQYCSPRVRPSRDGRVEKLIAVAVLPPDRDVAEVSKVFHDPDSVRRLIKRIGRPKGIWAWYEAGPTGYDLQRQLLSMGVRCNVVALSLIPKGSAIG